MKKQLLKYMLALIVLLTSCDGGFEKTDRAIFLKAPIDKAPCLEGEKEGSLVKIPFEWSIDGDLESIQLLVDELDSNKEILDPEEQLKFDIDLNLTKGEFPVGLGKWYQWQIISSDGAVESRKFTFYSEGPPDINRAPFPAEIEIIKSNEGQLSFTWSVPLDPNNDRLLYDAFFGTTRETPSEIKSNMLEPEVLEVSNPEIGTEYYIKVISKEVFQNNTIGNSSIALVKVIVEN